MNCRQHRSTMRRRVGAPSFAIRTASCMRQTIAERSAARAIRKSSSAPETFVKPACLFVLPRTWRYYQAIRHGAPFPYSMVPLAASAWPARPPERRRPTAVQLYRTTAARFRTAQRVLDQSSPHAVFRGAAAKSISFARCQRNQVHTPKSVLAAKGLTDAEQKAWDDAVAYYLVNYADKDLLFTTELIQLKDQLGDFEDCDELSGRKRKFCDAGLPPNLTQVLEAAAPVYRAHLWTEQ